MVQLIIKERHFLLLFVRTTSAQRKVLLQTITRHKLSLKDLISDFYLTSLQLVLCRVAAVKRLPVHQP